MPRNSNGRSISLKIFAVAAMSGIAAMGAAHAGDDVNFSYKQSELQSTAAIQNLYKRINKQAQSACNGDDARALYERRLAAECEADLVEDWIAGINDTRLNHMHAQHGGRQQVASVK